MTWQEASWIIWHHKYHSPVELKFLNLPCFPIFVSLSFYMWKSGRETMLHSSLHQHLYFSITSASSLACQQFHPRLHGCGWRIWSNPVTIFWCTSVSNCSFMPCKRDKTWEGMEPQSCIMMSCLEPQLDLTKIGLRSLIFVNFPYQSYPMLPSAEMIRLEDTCSLCELPCFPVLQLLVVCFPQQRVVQSRNPRYIFQHKANVYVCIYIYIYMYISIVACVSIYIYI